MTDVLEGLVAEMQVMRAQMAQMQAAAQRMPAPADVGTAVPMANDSEEEEESEPSWSDVLRQKRRPATSEEEAKFTRLLSTPPSLQSLKENRGDVALYQGVPEAPAARRNRVDAQLYQAQAKIEVGLHLMTHFLETGNKGALGGAAAWQRSAWEDLQQQRRQFLAGREAWKLDRRKDDQAVKLLTEEEEKKIWKQQRSEKSREGAGKGDRGRFRDSQPSWARKDWGSQDQSSWQDKSRTRSSSYGKGKGSRGKGSGRGRFQK